MIRTNMAAVTISALASFFSDENKSIQRGENHYKSNHIHSCKYSDGIIRGEVQASMKNKLYKVTIYLREGDIKSTECECPRGDYKCSHAAALAIHSIHNISRTDVECEWKKQKAPEQVNSVEDLYPCPKEYSCLRREVNDEDRSWFYEELKRYGNFTGILWLLSPEPERNNRLPITTVEDIVLSEQFVNHQDKKAYMTEKLVITGGQQKAVNVATVGQRDNPSWHMLRKGRLTASNFGPVLNCKRVTPSLIKRVLGQYDLSKVQAINWGITNENEAKKVFEQKTQINVEESGLWLQLSGMLGASPDGLIGANGLLEIKCPFTQRDSTIEEAVSSGNFYIKKNDEGKYELSKQHNYWHQVQGQLHLTGRNLCFFAVWTTKDILVLHIRKDPAWADNLLLLQDFYIHHIIPSIINDLL